MKKHMILFSVGKDRPGIVGDISTFLLEQNANIEDSRMAVMGGCFSVMTLFSCASDQIESIKAGLEDLKNLGLESSIHEAGEPTTKPLQPALPLRIDLTAMDHPGIVQKVVHILRNHNVNILDLNTQITQAPLSGAPLFHLSLESAVPAEKSISEVKEELTVLAAEINVDLNFRT